MKRLITIEEHYSSASITAKTNDILTKLGRPVSSSPNGVAPGADDIGEGRIAYMDKRGIDTQILSCPNAAAITMEPEYAVPLCKELNDEMYAATQKYPGRFYALAALPLGDPQAAAVELERCIKQLRFVGCLISNLYKEIPFENEFYLPIFEKAQELDVPVYMHPGLVPPDVTTRYYKGDWSPRTTFLFSSQGIGWHYDIGIQALRMMLSGMFDRLPNLKIILGHWGELVAFYMHRMDELHPDQLGMKKSFTDCFKENVYVDPSGMVYEDQLRFCMDAIGVDHILWGEDYPYRRIESIRTMLEGCTLTEEEREKIAHGNAERLFRIPTLDA